MQHTPEVFSFKQFTVSHSRCAMKVGTDGVLLGAWVKPPSGSPRRGEPETALDIGTGSGLIALMLAQRFPSLTRIIGMDIAPAAVAQASDNFARSPWASRLQAVEADFRDFTIHHSSFAIPHSSFLIPHWFEPSPQAGGAGGGLSPFRLIVCNPPFFTGGQHMPADRAAARQSTTLPIPSLMAGAAQLLQPTGSLAIIIPYEQATEAVVHAAAEGLHLTRRTDIRTKPDKPLTRTLLQWQKPAAGDTFPPLHADSLVLLSASNEPTPEYIALTHDFYLHL